jgi:hypothetical protein
MSLRGAAGRVALSGSEKRIETKATKQSPVLRVLPVYARIAYHFVPLQGTLAHVGTRFARPRNNKSIVRIVVR